MKVAYIIQYLKSRIPAGLKPFLLAVRRIYRRMASKISLISPLRPIKIAKFKNNNPLKLNIGCGKAKLPGWVNIDIEANADLVVDIRNGLPFNTNSVHFIYNEHFFEHIDFKDGERVLREFHRCLKEHGILRIAMPDLDWIVQEFNRDFKYEDWFPGSEWNYIKTKGMAINMAFRGWEHKYLYNEEDLRNQLTEVGFKNIKRCERNNSSSPELSDLETRKESRLIMEAEKA